MAVSAVQPPDEVDGPPTLILYFVTGPVAAEAGEASSRDNGIVVRTEAKSAVASAAERSRGRRCNSAPDDPPGGRRWPRVNRDCRW